MSSKVQWNQYFYCSGPNFPVMQPKTELAFLATQSPCLCSWPNKIPRLYFCSWIFGPERKLYIFFWLNVIWLVSTHHSKPLRSFWIRIMSSKELTVPPNVLSSANVVSIIYMSSKSLIKNAEQDSTLREVSLVVNNNGSLINTSEVQCLLTAPNSLPCHTFLALPHALGHSIPNWTH